MCLLQKSLCSKIIKAGYNKIQIIKLSGHCTMQQDLRCNPNWGLGRCMSPVLTFEFCKCAIKYICATQAGMPVPGPSARSKGQCRGWGKWGEWIAPMANGRASHMAHYCAWTTYCFPQLSYCPLAKLYPISQPWCSCPSGGYAAFCDDGKS